MYLEIRFHGRGGQGVVTASRIVAEAAHLDGYYSQSMPFFGAERRGAPVVSFSRISDNPIYRTSQIYNPDIIVVFDPMLLNLPNVPRGVKNAIINSEEPLKVAKNVVFVNATKIAIKYGLFTSGMVVPNIPMIGALLRSDIPISYETMEEVIERWFGEESRMVSSFKEGYRMAKRVEIEERMDAKTKFESKKIEKVELPISFPKAGVSGKTGLWRIVNPVLNFEKCNKCMVCWLYCPESAIKANNGIEIDYDYCKGCMVCKEVCPKGAIDAEEVILNV